MKGYVALHRKMLENPIVCKDAYHVAVWIYLLLNATHANYDTMFKGKRITLSPGQLLTGRKSIASKLKINESKVQRILKLFENEHQIEQQTSNQNRLITILQWVTYQNSEQRDKQQVNNDRTTDEQRVNTNNNVNNVNNENNVKDKIPSPIEEPKPKPKLYKPIVKYLNEKCGTHYRPTTGETKRLIDARVNEGFELKDFEMVIDKKSDEWIGTEHERYLRPQTLFGTKFESYLNQKIINKKSNNGNSNGNIFLEIMGDEDDED